MIPHEDNDTIETKSPGVTKSNILVMTFLKKIK